MSKIDGEGSRCTTEPRGLPQIGLGLVDQIPDNNWIVAAQSSAPAPEFSVGQATQFSTLLVKGRAPCSSESPSELTKCLSYKCWPIRVCFTPQQSSFARASDYRVCNACSAIFELSKTIIRFTRPGPDLLFRTRNVRPGSTVRSETRGVDVEIVLSNLRLMTTSHLLKPITEPGSPAAFDVVVEIRKTISNQFPEKPRVLAI